MIQQIVNAPVECRPELFVGADRSCQIRQQFSLRVIFLDRIPGRDTDGP